MLQWQLQQVVTVSWGFLQGFSSLPGAQQLQLPLQPYNHVEQVGPPPVPG